MPLVGRPCVLLACARPSQVRCCLSVCMCDDTCDDMAVWGTRKAVCGIRNLWQAPARRDAAVTPAGWACAAPPVPDASACTGRACRVATRPCMALLVCMVGGWRRGVVDPRTSLSPPAHLLWSLQGGHRRGRPDVGRLCEPEQHGVTEVGGARGRWRANMVACDGTRPSGWRVYVRLQSRIHKDIATSDSRDRLNHHRHVLVQAAGSQPSWATTLCQTQRTGNHADQLGRGTTGPRCQSGRSISP